MNRRLLNFLVLASILISFHLCSATLEVSAADVSLTWHHRTDQHTVNGFTGYILNETQDTGSYLSVTKNNAWVAGDHNATFF